jgi:hypothetical protein
MWMIIQMPADWQLDQAGFLTEHNRTSKFDLVTLTHTIRRVIIPHHAAVILKAVFQQQIERVLTQIPSR